MTTEPIRPEEARRQARARAEKALTALRRTEILCHRYGRASRADVTARRAEYQEALDDLACLADMGAGR